MEAIKHPAVRHGANQAVGGLLAASKNAAECVAKGVRSIGTNENVQSAARVVAGLATTAAGSAFGVPVIGLVTACIVGTMA